MTETMSHPERAESDVVSPSLTEAVLAELLTRIATDANFTDLDVEALRSLASSGELRRAASVRALVAKDDHASS